MTTHEQLIATGWTTEDKVTYHRRSAVLTKHPGGWTASYKDSHAGSFSARIPSDAIHALRDKIADIVTQHMCAFTDLK